MVPPGRTPRIVPYIPRGGGGRNGSVESVRPRPPPECVTPGVPRGPVQFRSLPSPWATQNGSVPPGLPLGPGLPRHRPGGRPGWGCSLSPAPRSVPGRCLQGTGSCDPRGSVRGTLPASGAFPRRPPALSPGTGPGRLWRALRLPGERRPPRLCSPLSSPGMGLGPAPSLGGAGGPGGGCWLRGGSCLALGSCCPAGWVALLPERRQGGPCASGGE